jgi:hypothetical protein
MALLGNYSVILKNPATFIGGTQVSNCRNAFNGNGQNLQMYYGESGTVIPLTSSIPSGTAPPYSWHFAEKGGGIATTTRVRVDPFAAGQMGVNLDSLATITATAEATLQLVASLLGTAAVSMVATADIEGVAGLVGDGSVSAAGTADIFGVGNLITSSSVTVTGSADIFATGSMHSLVYLNQSQATVDQIVDGVTDNLGSITATVPPMLNTGTGDIILPID